MIKTPFELVCDFHRKFGVPVRTTPQQLPKDEQEFRTGFMREELDEYERAVDDEDLTKQLDALVDLLYVIYGTLALHGFPADEAFELVHRANMQKQRATSTDESKEKTGRGHAFDVVKPEGWVSPEPKLELLLSLRRVYTEPRERTRVEALLFSQFLPERYVVVDEVEPRARR